MGFLCFEKEVNQAFWDEKYNVLILRFFKEHFQLFHVAGATEVKAEVGLLAVAVSRPEVGNVGEQLGDEQADLGVELDRAGEGRCAGQQN